MLAQIASASVFGVESRPVDVEVDVATGLPCFQVVGLPHGAVREGRDRVLTALGRVGYRMPPRRIVVNLAPADLPKEGSAFDLPIALGLLVGAGQLTRGSTAGTVFIGELGLDGSLRPVRGALSVAIGCGERGVERMVVPEANAREAAAVSSVRVFGFRHLTQVIEFLREGAWVGPAFEAAGPRPPPRRTGVLAQIRGQEQAKRALCVAAAGGHNLLLVGPPGAGKTLLARALPELLPPLDASEALAATRIHSVAGLLDEGAGLLHERPFRSPHHSISTAGLIGGGRPPRPGEASLAHCGVLFLDELPEFGRSAIESLRQPLEEGSVRIGRAQASVRFPARVQLVAAMNPCPCGFRGSRSGVCLCDVSGVRRYRARISGPLLDRIDLHVWVPEVDLARLGEATSAAETEAEAAPAAVARARMRQQARAGVARTNADLTPTELARFAAPGTQGRRLLLRAGRRLGLSARAYHRVLRVARTLADLADASVIDVEHLAEALQFRPTWGTPGEAPAPSPPAL